MDSFKEIFLNDLHAFIWMETGNKKKLNGEIICETRAISTVVNKCIAQFVHTIWNLNKLLLAVDVSYFYII